MNRRALSRRSFRRVAGIFGGLLLAVSAGLYTFMSSAQTEELKTAPEQALTNGRLALVRRSAGPAPSNYVMTADPDGSASLIITSPGEAMPTAPVWSPDGGKIAFAGTPGDIHVVNANGGGQTNLTNTPSPTVETNPSWSVTGKIAYAVNEQTAGGQIWTMNANGSGQAVFAGISQPSPFDPAWSPDGSKLAFVSNGEIWVINADGTNEQRVTTNATVDRDPAWSPDGAKIVFSKGGGGISIINANGTGEAPITTGTNDKQPAFSPDGTKIAFRGTSGLWTMEADGTNQVRIFTDVINFPLCCDLHFESPAWQPVAQVPNTLYINGRVTYNNIGTAGVTVDLYGTVNATTTTDAVGNFQFSGLPIGGGYIVTPAKARYYFTPPKRGFANMFSNQIANFEVDGVCLGQRCVKNGKIAFTRNAEILTINQDGTGETNITNNPASDTEPNYSPDGSNIVFTASRDGNNELYRMNADGSGPVRLTNNFASDTSPRYSPDGRSIVFVSDRDGNIEVYKMNADGSNQVRLTNNPTPDIQPAFSADGTRIIWAVYGSSQSVPMRVFTMNADGTGALQFPAPSGPFPAYERFSYSPDGSRIMFTFTPDASSVFKGTWTLTTDGGSGGPFGGGMHGTYSPDGLMAAFTCCVFDNTNRLRVSNAQSSTTSVSTLTPAATGNALPDWQPTAVLNLAPFDFDGDGRTDVAVHRPSNGVWYILGSTAGYWARQWSDPGDVLVPADYDGDRKADIAVWRPSDGNFYIINSFDATVRQDNFGLAGDVPTGGDWDGDGKADQAVYRDAGPGTQSYFYYRGSMGNPQRIVTFVPWGTTGDKPVVGDYDGDGRTDAAIYRNGDWWVLKSSDLQYIALHFGIASDRVVPADYDGDGKTDMAVYRDGTWYLLQSNAGFAGFGFGISTDQAAPGDYDGDGKTDAAILRDGTWWILNSANLQPTAVSFGSTGDKPVPGAFVR